MSAISRCPLWSFVRRGLLSAYPIVRQPKFLPLGWHVLGNERESERAREREREKERERERKRERGGRRAKATEKCRIVGNHLLRRRQFGRVNHSGRNKLGLPRRDRRHNSEVLSLLVILYIFHTNTHTHMFPFLCLLYYLFLSLSPNLFLFYL